MSNALLLEGACALAIASGTSALFYAFINICEQGDEIVSANNLYGGTYTMLNDILPQFGIKTTFVDPSNPDNFKQAITSRTRAIFRRLLEIPRLI